MNERLRGDPEGLVARIPKQGKKYGNREDGTPKGIGFFGEIARSDDREAFSTELSVSIGKESIPLLVPSLSAEEIAHLVDGGGPTTSIFQKALAHAQQRKSANLSPYAEIGEQVTLPKSANTMFKEGFHAR